MSNKDASLASDYGVAVCYLCLDGGINKTGQPLRRDCACRGTDAGFVHLSCFAGYAASKSELADKMSLDMNELTKPWRLCPSCHQTYQNKLAIDIATKFVSFVRRQYPDDTQMQVESLYLKLRALYSMLRRLQPVQKIEAGDTANVLLSLIDRMKGDASLSRRYSQMEAKAYNAHGHIALDEGTEESARRAVVHFGNELLVNEAIGDTDGIVTAKRNIARARSKYESDRNNHELMLKASRELYELRVAELGEESGYTICAGNRYALRLGKANRREEARELLMKLLATSKQVFGPHHNKTKEIELLLSKINKNLVVVVPDKN